MEVWFLGIILLELSRIEEVVFGEMLFFILIGKIEIKAKSLKFCEREIEGLGRRRRGGA